tara:strand:+ start:3452 stop:3871 length:420 start_codon:yes stop_codon:yes gene_type:complete
MSITLKQLQALSEEFEFDYNEARKFLGHSDPKKRGRPSKKVDTDSDDDVCTGSKCGKDVKKPRAPRNDNKTKKQETPKSEAKKSKGGGRAPSGYNLFVKDQGKPITECAKEWKKLTDAKRASWNSKAASKEKSIFEIFG